MMDSIVSSKSIFSDLIRRSHKPKEAKVLSSTGLTIFTYSLFFNLAKPMCNRKSRTIFSYAHDIGILGIGHKVIVSVVTAQQELDNFIELARINAVSFGFNKSKVV